MILHSQISAVSARVRRELLEVFDAAHAGNLLLMDLHLSVARQALLNLEALLDGAEQGPMRKIALVGKPDEEVEIEPWMAKKYDGGEPDGAA